MLCEISSFVVFLTLVSFFFSLSFNKIAFLWHLKHLIAIVEIIKVFRLPFTNLIAGMSVEEGPKKCVCWGALCLRERGSGVLPYCFRKGLVNLLWLLVHCVQPPPLVSSLSLLVQKTLASAAPQVSQPPSGSHLNFIHIILITSTNELACFTQIDMLHLVFMTFQRKQQRIHAI